MSKVKEIKLNTKEHENILLSPNYFNSIPKISLEKVDSPGDLMSGTYFISMCYEDEDKNLSPFIPISRPIVINNALEDGGDNMNPNSRAEFDIYSMCGLSDSELDHIEITIKTSDEKQLTFNIEHLRGDELRVIDQIAQLNLSNDFKGVKVGDTYFKVSYEVVKYYSYGDPYIYKFTVYISDTSLSDSSFYIRVKHNPNTIWGTTYGAYYYTETSIAVMSSSHWYLSITSDSDLSYIQYNKIKPSGYPSGKNFQIKYSELSTFYNKIRLAILYYEKSTLTSIKLTDPIQYIGNSVSYTISNTGRLPGVSLERIIISNTPYTRAKSMANHANRLLLHNVRVTSNYFKDFQKAANKIIIKGHWWDKYFNSTNVLSGHPDTINTFRDTKNSYYYQPFMEDEVYPFYIRWLNKKGGTLCVNHIPGGIGYGGKNVLDPHIIGNTYPHDFPELAGSSIRYHKMPSWHTINDKWTTNHRLLGIEIEGVVPPNNLKDKCAGWEIFYAERSSENITKLGHGYIPYHIATSMSANKKFVSFDVIYNRLSTSSISSIQLLGRFHESLGKVNNYTTQFSYLEIPDNLKYYVARFEYGGGINERYGRQDFLELYKSESERYNSESGETDLKGGIYDINSSNNPLHIYSNLNNQTLVSTGIIRNADDSKSGRCFGGDTYISRFGYRHVEADRDESYENYETATNVHYVALKSHYNLELRHEGIEPYQKIYPQSTGEEVNDMPAGLGGYISDDLGISYDRTYSKINNIENPMVDSKNFDNIFSNRIAFSSPNIDESTQLGWRTFKPNDYYDVGFNRGHGIKLITQDKNLYIQNRYGLFVAQVKDVLQISDDTEIWLGTADLFDRPPRETLYDSSGGIGCRDYDSAIICELGYVVCDRDKNSIFVISKESKDITSSNFKNWFTKKIKTDNDDIVKIQFDKPRKRFLINIDNLDLGEHHTLSYSILTGGLTSFHHYNKGIKDIINNRMGTIIVYRDTTKKSQSFVMNEFINEPIENIPSFIDVNITVEPTIQKLFQSIIWRTEYTEEDRKIWDETIDKLMVYNNTQCTGLLDVNNSEMWYDTSSGVYKSDQWIFNKLLDIVNDDKQPFLTNNMLPIPANLSSNKGKNWFEKSQFISKFVTVRLQSDNRKGQRIKFMDLLMELIKDPR